MHCPLFLAAVLMFSICPIVLGEPVLSLGQLTLQNSDDDKPQTLSTIALTKCQSDYLSALIHRCMIRGAPTMPEGRICFTDEVQLEDAYKLVGYISEMCCLLRCQAKTLERLCCRHAQQGRCRKFVKSFRLFCQMVSLVDETELTPNRPIVCRSETKKCCGDWLRHLNMTVMMNTERRRRTRGM